MPGNSLVSAFPLALLLCQLLARLIDCFSTSAGQDDDDDDDHHHQHGHLVPGLHDEDLRGKIRSLADLLPACYHWACFINF